MSVGESALEHAGRRPALPVCEEWSSGGRKKIATLTSAIHPREHRVFYGAFDPSDPPKSMQERLVRLMPAAKSVLPAGDFREWDAIETWAREIAAELVPKVLVG